MTTPYVVPLIAQNQSLSVSLSGTVYQFRILWNKWTQTWIADIFSSAGVALLQGVPLVAGANLLAQFGYLGIANGALVVQSDNDPLEPPSSGNLGSNSNLYYVAN